MDTKYGIGIDLGGTHIKGVLLERGGNILKKEMMATNDDEGAADLTWKKAVSDMLQLLKKDVNAPYQVGISAPGITEPNHQCIAYMPGRLEGLEGLDWGAYLGEPDTRVINDAKSALLAEYHFGAAQEKKHIIILTLGTGVGGAIMIDGKLYKGWLNRAGHVGHISQHPFGEGGILDLPGTLEMNVGNATIKQRTMGRYESTAALVKAYEQKDYYATLIWLETMRDLARGLSSLINVLSPELILLSGGITKAGPTLFDPLNALMDVYEWQPGGKKTPIKKAKFGSYAGAVGAACFALFK